jgi:hypothetical protein
MTYNRSEQEIYCQGRAALEYPKLYPGTENNPVLRMFRMLYFEEVPLMNLNEKYRIMPRMVAYLGISPSRHMPEVIEGTLPELYEQLKGRYHEKLKMYLEEVKE